MEESNNNSGFNIPGEFGALASFWFFGWQGYIQHKCGQRASRRGVIIDMKEKYALDADPIFNDYSPKSADPFGRRLLRLVGWQEIATKMKSLKIKLSPIIKQTYFLKLSTPVQL